MISFQTYCLGDFVSIQVYEANAPFFYGKKGSIHMHLHLNIVSVKAITYLGLWGCRESIQLTLRWVSKLATF